MMTHGAVRRAAAIAIPDEKWGERPLLVIEPEGLSLPDPAELIEHLRPLVPKWWLPERFAFLTIPLGATGKIDKVRLRVELAAGALPSSDTPC